MVDVKLHSVKWNEETITRIWDYYGGNPYYQKQYFTNHSGHRILNVVRKAVEIKGKVVDYGCGPGHLLKHLEIFPDWDNYIGIDSSSHSLDQVQKLKSTINKSIDWIHNKDVLANENKKTADLVFCIEVIEHCNEFFLEKIISDIRHLLKTNGYLIVTVPNNENLEQQKQICPECGCIYHKWQHMTSWTPEGIQNKLEFFGFAVRKIFSCNFSQDNLGFKKMEKALLYLRHGKDWIFNSLDKPHIMLVAQVAN